jgi:release factor glutamine methyltransferase
MKADSPSTWTILRLLQWATGYFQAKGVSEPRASAEVLLAHCLGTSRVELYLRYDQPLIPEELARYKALIKRRLQGEPTQYITGHQEFWSMDFLVSPAALIPRPETEILVEAILDQVHQADFPRAGLRLLDLGTGSGILAIVLARELLEARVVALDISRAALKLAQENAGRHQVLRRIDFVQGNLWQALAPHPNFMVIMSNPPYIPHPDLSRLPVEVGDFEPRLALDGGPDGLEIIRTLVAQAHQYLVPGGLLALEIGHDQAEKVLKILERHGAYGEPVIRKDYQGIARVVLAPKKISEK